MITYASMEPDATSGWTRPSLRVLHVRCGALHVLRQVITHRIGGDGDPCACTPQRPIPASRAVRTAGAPVLGLRVDQQRLVSAARPNAPYRFRSRRARPAEAPAP